MFSALDSAKTLLDLPEGVAPGADRGAEVTGRLLGLDIPKRLAQVSVNGSEGVWIPAQPDIYTPNGLVRVERSPLDGGRLTRCLGPLDGVVPLASGVVTAVNSGTLTVNVLGGSYELPYVASTYDVDDRVHVYLAANLFGRPVIVMGPEGGFEGANPSTPGGGAGNPGQLVNLEAVIGPQWSGSWNGSRWDSWNPGNNAYGGRSALYQGAGYGSPTMRGLAVYGDQIVNLGAVAITRMLVTVIRVGQGAGGGTKTAVLQPSPHGGAYPGGGAAETGSTSSVALNAGQSAQFDLNSGVFEGFRTGSYKGLAAVGSDYLNLHGTSQPGAMVLVVQYQAVR